MVTKSGTSSSQSIPDTANRFSRKQSWVIARVVRAELDQKGRPKDMHRHKTKVEVNNYTEDEANLM